MEVMNKGHTQQWSSKEGERTHKAITNIVLFDKCRWKDLIIKALKSVIKSGGPHTHACMHSEAWKGCKTNSIATSSKAGTIKAGIDTCRGHETLGFPTPNKVMFLTIHLFCTYRQHIHKCQKHSTPRKKKSLLWLPFNGDIRGVINKWSVVKKRMCMWLVN